MEILYAYKAPPKHNENFKKALISITKISPAINRIRMFFAAAQKNSVPASFVLNKKLLQLSMTQAAIHQTVSISPKS
jgi:hypothetical protein